MVRLSFTKEERLLRPSDFIRVRKSGARASTRSFNIYVLPNDLNRRRLGLSVSARVGGAVKRNRIKRLLREFFRLNKEVFPGASDILVSVKDRAETNDLKDVEKELTKAVFSQAPSKKREKKA